ncbi:hypothetical protein [Flavihumibacter sp. CACIAM 22H1]|uniref:hypothetical protein n=1 Tax=Flavihumibacter sp. CACIAM 22H1 TaxID=1812911 RepID=UPI0007A8AA6F|nr:hypothetical protein [Flavihumibacter sp. CACIAM 22H1]KYP16289.1 MAG: hypothetical protein A1D16_20335 [Flavihumibacter sp. CACIAM 22H1]
MKSLSSYKITFSSLLLLLYGFIATPVQLWHHHAAPQEAEEGKLQVAEMRPADQPELHTNCSVCAHAYTVYLQDQLLHLYVNEPVFARLFAMPLFQLDATALANRLYRGPPPA